MVTGELKNKIDGLWEIFWTGGITNPLTVIEQMTYLMFIHDLDDTDNRRAKESAMLDLPYRSIFDTTVRIGEEAVEGHQLKWSVFHDFPADRMYSLVQEGVFPFIKNLHDDKDSAYSQYMKDAIFVVPTPLMLDNIVTALDGLYEQMARLTQTDVCGDVYEYLLSKISTAGVNGQFRTPRHIIRMMVAMMAPKADDVVCDGVLFGSSAAHKAIRKELVEANRLEAVIAMPSGVFKPYAGVSTAVLIFTKTGHGGTDRVWFYDMKADGFSLDDKRTEVAENDIPDILKRFQSLEQEQDRKRTEQSFFVPAEEIRENGYDLSVNKYKEVEYQKVEYPSTEELMNEIEALQGELTEELAKLTEML